jgi:hypothetical protein
MIIEIVGSVVRLIDGVLDLCPGHARIRKLRVIEAYVADPTHDRRTGRLLARYRDELMCEAVVGFRLNAAERRAVEAILRGAPSVSVSAVESLFYACREQPGIPIAHWIAASCSLMVGVILIPGVLLPLVGHITSWGQLLLCVGCSCPIEIASLSCLVPMKALCAARRDLKKISAHP